MASRRFGRRRRAETSDMARMISIAETVATSIPRPVRARLRRLFGSWPPGLGQVTAAQIAGTRPISQDFGWDRGTPIDRFYIERFLSAHAADIKGRALEVGDAAYCRRFGGDKVSRQEVLHVDPAAPAATIIGDLNIPGSLPSGAFDCIVLTQTLHLLFDVAGAFQELTSALAPGGVLLLTVPGISAIDRQEWRERWFWSLTGRTVEELARRHVPDWPISIEQHGNIFAAVSFLHGLALEEVDAGKLVPIDPAYPVIITAHLRRPASRDD